MKKSALIASVALAGLGLSTASHAQSTFADVPNDHWAIQAIEKLAGAKIVIGRPDGKYHGKDNLTRYEFAVALARVLDILDSRYAKIDHTHPAPDMSGYVTKEELRAALEGKANKGEVGGGGTTVVQGNAPDMKDYVKQQDFNNLRKMVGEFQTELTTLGVDVDGVKKRLTALEGRVAALETAFAKQIKITGTFNTYVRSNSRTGTATTDVTDKDGFLVTGGPGTRGGALADTRALHDLDLDFKARAADNASFEGTLTLGNYLSYLNGGAGARSNRGGALVNQDQTQTLWKAILTTGVNLPVLGNTGVKAGRIPTMFGDYTFKTPDADSYFTNSKTDMGTLPTDGVQATFRVASIAFTAQAAKINPITTGTGLTLTPGVVVGASKPAGALTRALTTGVFQNRTAGIAAEQFGGVNANFNISRLNVGLTSLYFGGGTNAGPGSTAATLNGNGNFDTVNVLGADVSTRINFLGLASTVVGHYAKSDTRGTTATSTSRTNKVTKNNTATDVSAQVGRGNYMIHGGYRRIDPLFAAPGAWARVGSYQNPTDIQGGYGKASINVTRKIQLNGSIQDYKGIGKAGVSALTTKDKISNVGFGAKWSATNSSTLEAGAETTTYTVAANTAAKPREMFTNISYNYAFNALTNFRVLYQIVDFDGKGNAAFLGGASNKQKGNIVAGQFSVRF